MFNAPLMWRWLRVSFVVFGSLSAQMRLRYLCGMGLGVTSTPHGYAIVGNFEGVKPPVPEKEIEAFFMSGGMYYPDTWSNSVTQSVRGRITRRVVP